MRRRRGIGRSGGTAQNGQGRRPTGVAWTRVSVRHYDGWLVTGRDPLGREHVWFTVRPLASAAEGTDRPALERGLVSMTPLRLDLSDDACLEEVGALDEAGA